MLCLLLASTSYFWTDVRLCVKLCCTFCWPSTSYAKMLGQNHFAEPNQYVLTFLHPKFAVQCTSGVALISINTWAFQTFIWVLHVVNWMYNRVVHTYIQHMSVVQPKVFGNWSGQEPDLFYWVTCGCRTTLCFFSDKLWPW